MIQKLPLIPLVLTVCLATIAAPAQEGTGSRPLPAGKALLNKQHQLDRQTFWDNRDWDWYSSQIPFFECPDSDITTTWYYRWELLTKHLTYGSPNSGYSFTEFIDRPFWSGAYGAISCPAGHQLYEARWLRSPRIARDYARYWFRTPGAQPRNYSTWLADSVWALQKVHPDDQFTVDLLDDLIRNYTGWEQRQFVPEVGLFWQNGHDDGMEFNINSRQTRDILRGAEGFRPSFNAYMWADATAIARIARLAGRDEIAKTFQVKADALKERLQALLWDDRRSFFLQVYRHAEERDGHTIQALSKTYETGRFAGSPHGRELIGYIPWQFNLPDRGRGFESAWKFLMDPDFFFAPFGPTTVERHDPLFLLQKTCCWWSGQSWPYATTQTLKGLANLLQNEPQSVVTPADYVKSLAIYARSHRKEGRPYLAEALHPDTGSFEGHDGYNHSEHYFHSGYCDLVITGLTGLIPRDDDTLEIHPLAPADWDYFAIDDLSYHGHRVTIAWDKLGTRYGIGPGLHVVVDGNTVATSGKLEKLTAKLPKNLIIPAEPITLNYAVNNDGDYFPRYSASFVAPQTSLAKVADGNYWYLRDPPNRWTCAGSENPRDWIAVDLGTPRRIDTAKLYFLDDGSEVVPPVEFQLEYFEDDSWQPVPGQQRHPEHPAGHRPNVVSFPPLDIQRLRAVFTHGADGKTGLTEWELWGPGKLPYLPPPPPAGNLAFNSSPEGFPRATASFTDRFGGKPASAIDGKIIYLPTPMNRWTCYESPHASDWLELDFGTPREFGRVELHIYDDRGGVQPPEKCRVEIWNGTAWRDVADQVASPAVPAGGVANSITFPRVKASKVRFVFTHKGPARSGVTEVEVWRE